MACRLLRSLVTALTLAGPAVVATSAELQAPTMAPTTIMEKEMEGLRHDLNALAAEGRRIGGTADPAGRRALRGAHLARLRAAIASTRAMESRMHEALDRGQIASDRALRARVIEAIRGAGVDQALLTVVVSKGVVQRWGTVYSAEQKRAARIAAQNVHGVRSVVDNVAVLPPQLRAFMGGE